jgi:hypothetical protein
MPVSALCHALKHIGTGIQLTPADLEIALGSGDDVPFAVFTRFFSQ